MQSNDCEQYASKEKHANLLYLANYRLMYPHEHYADGTSANVATISIMLMGIRETVTGQAQEAGVIFFAGVLFTVVGLHLMVTRKWRNSEVFGWQGINCRFIVFRKFNSYS